MENDSDSSCSSRSSKRRADSEAEGQTSSKSNQKMADRNRRNSKQGSDLEATMLAIEKRQSERMDKLVSCLEKNNEEVSSLRNLISTREEAVLEEVKRRDDKTNARLDELEAKFANGLAGGREAKRAEAYRDCRRSIRLWPVKGAELKPAVSSFLREKLLFSEEDLKRMGNISIKKYRDPASKTPDEVLILFESKRSRDAVKAAGKHLAGLGGSAGMKLHIPGHLQGNFNTLQNLGYHLKQSDETIRRSIKFDDEREDLVMDVFVDNAWQRIRPEEAKKVADENPDISSGPKILSAAGITSILKKKNPATGANTVPL